VAFKKGNTHGKGRPKGASNKVTKEARDLFVKIMNGEVGHIEDALDALRSESSEKYLKALSSLFPYFMPKQQELSVTTDITPSTPSWFDDVLERTDQKESNFGKEE